MSKTIFFDFDGVLVDSFEACFKLNKALDPVLTEEEYRSRFLGNINDAPHRGNRITDKEFFSRYEAAIINLPPIKGMPESLDRLSARYELIIVSSNHSEGIEKWLIKNNLRSCFTEILGNDKGKKKDEKINSALTKRKQKAEQALMVTDTVGDITEARKAGVQSIAVSWGYMSERYLVAANPSALVRDSLEFQTQLCHFIDHLELFNQSKSNPFKG